jgi:hypothetical protein
MQATMVHFCDKTMFFPWVPFIQMHVVINISIDILIETWIKIHNFIMKILCGYLLIKFSFIGSNGLLKLKNMDSSSNWNITKWKK